MRIVLLFVLLTSVCGDPKDGCLEGWFEFTCNSNNKNDLQVTDPDEIPIRIPNIEDNKWKPLDARRFLYHNTTGKYWRVLVTQLTRKDFGEYKCNKKEEREIDLKYDNPDCPQHSQTAVIGASTTIRCRRGHVNFICKQSLHNDTCDILSRGPNPVYHISDVSRQDQGVYWCGHESRDYKMSKKKIELQVQVVEVTKRSVNSGQDLTHQCNYANASIKKFVCKGESSTKCQELVNTSRWPSGRFTLEDAKTNWMITLTIRHVTIEDSGSYWFGTEGTGNGNEKVFFHKLELTVAEMTSPPSPTHPVVEVTKRSVNPGQDLTHQCNYTNASIKKFVCKGESSTKCQELVNTFQRSNGRFTLKDVKTDWMILTIQHVTIEDSGSYWFGTVRTRNINEKVFFHKLELTVAEMTSPPSPTHPDERWKTLVIVIPVCVAVLLLALIGFCIHKRLSSSRKTALTCKEEHCYDEIQARPPQTGSGTALKTIYATATAPGSSGNEQLSDKTFKENVLYDSH